MDFLNTLYSNDNFGIILFITISILVLAFLIILFFGKKDQKERKLAETKSLEINNTLAQNAFTDEEPTVQLNIDPEVFERPLAPVPEPVIENNNVLYEQINPDISKREENPFSVDEKVEAPIESSEVSPVMEEAILPPKMDFDFDALADSISKELESISTTKEETAEPIQMEQPNIFKEEVKKEIEENHFAAPVTPVTPVIQEEPEKSLSFETAEKPKMPSPTQFSSVFVSKKKEPNLVENYETVKPVVEEPKEPVMPQVTPAKPKIELPKTIDLPKLNTENTSNNQPNNSGIVFSSLEQDMKAYPGNDENRM